MESTVSARPSSRRRWALIVPGIVALLGSLAVATPARAGYYDEGYYSPAYPCSYRCGYPAYRHYPVYHRRYGSRLLYERRYVEREYVERRYGYSGYRGCSSYWGCRRHYGYYPSADYGSRSRPWGYPYGGIGHRWPTPFLTGYGAADDGYEEPPRPPAPVYEEGGYDY